MPLRKGQAESVAPPPPPPSHSISPAKTFIRSDGRVQLGRSVFNHCQIVGAVAREIIRRQPPTLALALFPEGSHLAAAAHDIGKVSPTFVEKLRRACDPQLCTLAPIANVNPGLESKWGGHAGVSQLTAKALGVPAFVPEILGQHHGFAPPVAGCRALDPAFGGAAWQAERVALVDALKQVLDADWPLVADMPQARVLAGLASVADWIGSGEFFEDPASPWESAVPSALDAAGFVAPACRPGLDFDRTFGFSPRVAQQRLIDQVVGPGVYVLEAPMGDGKTEAALFAAYRVLVSGQASGIYFALPTQLTSNKILERFNAFLARILAPGSAHRALLLHANAWQVTDMGEDGQPGGAWFNQAKRGLLAPFAVGTIDQALMAAMNVKHGFVRAFGLAGKVVILDEVHTYDAYTGTLLDALVELLRALHCTVIILSATLNQDRRGALLGAPLRETAYPLITAQPRCQTPVEVPIPPPPEYEVALHLLADDQRAVDEALGRAALGEQVLWIENTVADAQERYLDLAARAHEAGVGCGLLHSRYTPDDRARIEERWVNLFGKPGWGDRAAQGRILIGTQVLEQSLDIDADFLVTRFAPTDMLLQRLGRLWRHVETPRPSGACRQCWLLAPALTPAVANPTTAFGSSAYVYSPYILCRSLEVWQGLGGVRLPTDIRPLIEATYLRRQEEAPMSRWLHELEHGTPRRIGTKALRQLARVTLAEVGRTQPEHKAQTRYSETDQTDVLLVRALSRDRSGHAATVTLLDGRTLTLPLQRHRLSKSAWRERATTLMRQVVPVRHQDAPPAVSPAVLRGLGLHHCFYIGDPDQDEAVLRVALLDESGWLHGLDGSAVDAETRLGYRSDLGYRVIKGWRGA
jgi:CRISPR-associated endonuclease/helicase Cas3